MKRLFFFIIAASIAFASAAQAQYIGYAPQYASTAEAQAGTSTTKTMTPARAADAMATYALYPAGVAIGYNFCSSTALITTAGTALPQDDTIPQITEGDEIITCAYTAKLATSKIRFVFDGSISAAAAQHSCSLFIDATANALASDLVNQASGASASTAHLSWTFTAPDTAAHTYRIRCGSNAGAAENWNGYSAARKFGGTNVTAIEIMEIKQ